MTVACPACVAGPDDVATAGSDGAGGVLISLPGIHCAACISGVERILMTTNGVISARVNLGLRRVRVLTVPGLATDGLISALKQAGYEAVLLDEATLGATKDAEGNDLLMRLAAAGFAMMNVMLLSVAVWSGASDATRDMFHWLSAMIALPAVIYAGQPFYRHAMQALRVGRLNMDVPISLAIILASAMSLYETMQGGQHAYFDAALSLTFFLLIGRYLDHRTRLAARSAARELAALEVSTLTRVVDGIHEQIALAQVQTGDILHIPPGVRIPVDGVVTQGGSQIDRSFITGESLPHGVEADDALIAGDVNLTGPLQMRATAVGEDTTLRKIAALVEIAETARNSYTGLADRAAAIYAPAVHLLAFAALIGWWVVAGDLRQALNVAIAVLIITCPCALGLAVPAVTTVASGKLFRRGLLLKNATVLERLAEVDTVVFDKTGTLTTGRAMLDLDALSDSELSVLKALAAASHHPVAGSILGAIPKGVQPAELVDVSEVSGSGVQGLWNGERVRLGRAQWVGAPKSPAFQIGDKSPICLSIEEHLRDGVVDAIDALHAMNLRTTMLTGDVADAAAPIAQLAGIADVHANMRPEEKFAMLEAQRSDGHKVLMVGDGLNDTPALAQAHVSMAPGSAIDAARIASDIVLLNPSFGPLPVAIRIAKQARQRVTENFATAVIYNLIAVPIALAGFATPLLAAIAMSLSSICVLLNSMRIQS